VNHNTNNSEAEITPQDKKNTFEDFSATTFDHEQNKNIKISINENTTHKQSNTEIKLKECDGPDQQDDEIPQTTQARPLLKLKDMIDEEEDDIINMD
jgi:hypothetical protein